MLIRIANYSEYVEFCRQNGFIPYDEDGSIPVESHDLLILRHHHTSNMLPYQNYTEYVKYCRGHGHKPVAEPVYDRFTSHYREVQQRVAVLFPPQPNTPAASPILKAPPSTPVLKCETSLSTNEHKDGCHTSNMSTPNTCRVPSDCLVCSSWAITHPSTIRRRRCTSCHRDMCEHNAFVLSTTDLSLFCYGCYAHYHCCGRLPATPSPILTAPPTTPVLQPLTLDEPAVCTELARPARDS